MNNQTLVAQQQVLDTAAVPVYKPVAWGLFAEVAGELILQHPVRFTRQDAEADRAMYASSTRIEIRALYSTPAARVQATEALRYHREQTRPIDHTDDAPAGRPLTDAKMRHWLDSGEEGWQPCVKLPVTVYVRHQREGEQHVSTREGLTPVRSDDLIMRGVQGEEYPIGRYIFEKTYRLGEAPVSKRLTDEQIDRAVAAWFEGTAPPNDAGPKFRARMRDAIKACGLGADTP